ncbi:hypothetical protein PT974_08825 [Cladobotryum mycophilum]|uniref:Yeast cell wall synthesis Kre9/Knh1-like N-terminal domain-containing protein n=1 Tax=Cladobotryum mycophilum TaxID=491253 RepID=A0ABR0SFE2_9HYPO
MRFSLTAVLALAASAFAQTADFDPIFTPTANQEVAAGSVLTITWEAPAKYAAGTVSIELIGGKTQNTQVPLQVIATGVQNSAKSFSWKIDASLGAEAVYGLVFKLESNPSVFQYSNPFHIKAGSTQPTGDVTTTVTTSTGIKTISLSSAATTAPAVTTTATTATTIVTSVSVSIPETTVVVDQTTTVPCNGTTATWATSTYAAPQGPSSGLPPKVTYTSTAWAAPSNPPVPTGGPVVPPTNGAARVGSSIAVIGGIVAAFLVL